jgi:hypothetical protein
MPKQYGTFQIQSLDKRNRIIGCLTQTICSLGRFDTIAVPTHIERIDLVVVY